MGLGAGQQHDAVGDPHQFPGGLGGGHRTPGEAEGGEAVGLRGAERGPRQVAAYGVYGGPYGGRQGRSRAAVDAVEPSAQ
ncbi:hypothetical protein [Streptomyces sp. YIM S03343]